VTMNPQVGTMWSTRMATHREPCHVERLSCLSGCSRTRGFPPIVIFTKSGQITPLKDVALQTIHRFGKAVHRDGFEPRPVGVLNEHRQGCNVVQVGVRDEDVADSGLIVRASPETQAPGVDSQNVIHQITAGVLFGLSTL